MKRKIKDKKQIAGITTDPLGSYTGNYLLGKLEEPVQDVDDL